MEKLHKMNWWPNKNHGTGGHHNCQGRGGADTVGSWECGWGLRFKWEVSIPCLNPPLCVELGVQDRPWKTKLIASPIILLERTETGRESVSLSCHLERSCPCGLPMWKLRHRSKASFHGHRQVKWQIQHNAYK